MPASPLWNPEEIEIVHKYYTLIGPTAIHKQYLVDRSINAIHLRDKALGYTFDRSAKPKVPRESPPKALRSGIYILRWESGHFYIGKSKDINKRFSNHRHRNTYAKYGKCVLDIICKCEVEDLAYMESVHISKHIKDVLCLNKVIPKA
jgi:predicted GIY-YIG superfamily endonuclease